MDGRPESDRQRDTAALDEPPWLTLDGETLLWQGSPRIQTALPGVVVGLAVAAVGVGLGIGVGPGARPLAVSVGNGSSLVAVGALVVGVWVAASAYLGVRNTEYAVTDRALYRKQGVLSRTVTAVDYRTVQNVSDTRGVTGALFGYGSLGFDTAGGEGTELAFSNLDNPAAVRRLVSEQLSRVRHAEGVGAGDDRLPGSVEQWEAVLGEVRAIRRSLEGGDGETTVEDR